MRKSISSILKRQFELGFKLFYIVTLEDETVINGIDEVLGKYVSNVIHYDILQGFDVPFKETSNQIFSETVEKWLYEHTFENTALVIRDSNIFAKDDKNIVAVQKMVAAKSYAIVSQPQFVIIISDYDNLPKQLKKYASIVEIPLMSSDERIEYIKSLYKNKSKNIKKEFVKKIADCCSGLTEAQVELCADIIDKNSDQDIIINHVHEQKIRFLNQSEFISDENVCYEEDLGGYEKLKEWIKEKKKLIDMEDIPIDLAKIMPKGMMLVGIPGCGKSLCAKASAGILGFPLLRLDFGLLMNKYVGETEKNLDYALRISEAMEPCVLWLDEFEKVFGENQDNNGISQRMLGKFLTWLQELKKMIFIVATVNNVSKLPPELLRRGRFDKIYYVDVPNNEARQSIIQIHTKNLGIDIDSIKIAEIAAAIEGKGYSGADIEYAIKEAKGYLILDKSGELDIKNTIITSLNKATPIGNIMCVEIENMRKEFSIRGFESVG